MPIRNAKNIKLNEIQGGVPNMQETLYQWYQQITFGVVTKRTVGYQELEELVEVIFRGVIQPLSPRRLAMKPEGQQAWTWQWVHSDPSLQLNVDDIIKYLGVQYRVMARSDYTLYGYMEYELVEDYREAGPPQPQPEDQDIDGGAPDTVIFDHYLDGGDADGD